jgi:hypothetical protein
LRELAKKVTESPMKSITRAIQTRVVAAGESRRSRVELLSSVRPTVRLAWMTISEG